MIGNRVLVDTGPLVAILSRRDMNHRVCVEQSQRLVGPLLTCWPVLTEAAWLLRDTRPLLSVLESGKLVCLELETGAATQLRLMAQQYATLKPQLADLALAYLAEREGIDQIFTLDRRDFLVYRTSRGDSFKLLPEAL